MARLPSVLGHAVIKDSYSWKPNQAFIRTEMEAGNVRQRRITTANTSTFNCTLALDRTGVAVLEAWYKYSIHDGADWFLMPFINSKGDMEDVEVRFTEPYAVTLSGHGRYEAALSLEIKTVPMLTPEELAEYE